MAKLGRWQATIVDEAGNVQPFAQVEVRSEATGNLATLFEDSAGTGGLLNPLTADADGYVFFYAALGDYKIRASLGGFEREWRDEPVFSATSLGGAEPYREVTEAGDVDVEPTDKVIGINKDVGEPTTVNLPPAADRNGIPVTIKDIKRDANTNPITPAFDGLETCDGQAGSAFQITTPGGWLILYPREGGYYTLGNQL